jgi:tRNA C32,U32 (ribose-2'-O)-methylase TrmJ
MKARLAELEAEKASLASRQASAPMPTNVSVHPDLTGIYRKKVEELEQLLDGAEHRDEAMELIRSLIEKIELNPREVSGLDGVLYGDLACVQTLCSTGQQEAEQQKALAGGASRGLLSCDWLRGQDLNL